MERFAAQHAYIRTRIELFVTDKILTAFDKFLEYEMVEPLERLLSSPEFAEIDRVYKKVPRHSWENYKTMELTGLTEQNLMDKAIKKFAALLRVEMKSYKPKD